MTTAIREALTTRPDAVDSRTYLGAGRQAMAETAASLIKLVATAA